MNAGCVKNGRFLLAEYENITSPHAKTRRARRAPDGKYFWRRSLLKNIITVQRVRVMNFFFKRKG